METICKLEQCENLVAPAGKARGSRGWCVRHYRAFLKHGDPTVFKGLKGESLETRFWAKVDKSGGEDACWLWTSKLYRAGYGDFRYSSEKKHYYAHKLSYELAYGSVPRGKVLDHTCHNPKDCPDWSQCRHRRCVNPSHLEAVTQKENVLRGGSFASVNKAKTHCINGHAFDEENTYTTKDGKRKCRACGKINRRKRTARLKILALEEVKNDQ